MGALVGLLDHRSGNVLRAPPLHGSAAWILFVWFRTKSPIDRRPAAP